MVLFDFMNLSILDLVLSGVKGLKYSGEVLVKHSIYSLSWYRC